MTDESGSHNDVVLPFNFVRARSLNVVVVVIRSK